MRWEIMRDTTTPVPPYYVTAEAFEHLGAATVEFHGTDGESVAVFTEVAYVRPVEEDK